MIKKPVFIQPISINAFRHPSNINGKIIGMEYIAPNNLKERLCYKVEYLDMVDYIPVSDVESGLYKIVDTYYNSNNH